MADFNLETGYEVPIGTSVQQISTTVHQPTTLTNVAVNDASILTDNAARITSDYVPVDWTLNISNGSVTLGRSIEQLPPRNRPDEGQLYPRLNK
tara:strand:+ start:614 stop:895 length:282 start_codon:yes stop_codon:yes gene_type:complete